MRKRNHLPSFKEGVEVWGDNYAEVIDLIQNEFEITISSDARKELATWYHMHVLLPKFKTVPLPDDK